MFPFGSMIPDQPSRNMFNDLTTHSHPLGSEMVTEPHLSGNENPHPTSTLDDPMSSDASLSSVTDHSFAPAPQASQPAPAPPSVSTHSMATQSRHDITN